MDTCNNISWEGNAMDSKLAIKYCLKCHKEVKSGMNRLCGACHALNRTLGILAETTTVRIKQDDD
jgi:hypothetical protein